MAALDEGESRFTRCLCGLIVTHTLQMMRRTPARRGTSMERGSSARSQAQACCLSAAHPRSGKKAFVCHSKLQSAVVNSELFDLFDLRYIHGVNTSGSISSVGTRNALLRNRGFLKSSSSSRFAPGTAILSPRPGLQEVMGHVCM